MSTQTVKTDNASLATKIGFRRWLLERMHLTDVRVLDTCAGAGHIWTTMQEHVTVSKWIRCDVKPRQAGTLQMTALEAVKVLPLSEFDVIDIDPYGDPFSAYLTAVKRLTQPTAFFLTHGRVMHAAMLSESLEAIGIPPKWNIPRTPALSFYAPMRSLEETWKYADITHAASVNFTRVDYYALCVTPRS